jgi:cytochrome c oxidase subunit 2
MGFSTNGMVGRARRLGAWLAASIATLLLIAPVALAAPVTEPHDWQLGFQPAATPVRDRIDFLHDDVLLPIITVISVFVLGLLLYVIVKFNAKRHPTPSATTHNTVLELAWTIVPVLILLGIFFPSMSLLYFNDKAQHADMTLKVTGHQWYWTYEYPDQGLTQDKGNQIDSNMIPEEDAVKEGKRRLLDVDNPVIVPVGATIRILVTGTDVIHSWFVPSVGVQEYAVVGRTNESWMKIERAGIYYGQCNQICGLNHPFMPIEIEAVEKPTFDAWVACQQKSDKDRPKEGCGSVIASDDRGGKDAVRVAEQATK